MNDNDAQAARKLMMASMYGQRDEPSVAEAGTGTAPNQPLSLKYLYSLVLRQQALIDDQARHLRRLTMRIDKIGRSSKGFENEVGDIYRELDRKVTRRD